MAKDAPSELTKVHVWRARIQSELDSQLRYGKEWGSLEPEDRRPGETIEEDIARLEAEVARLKRESKVADTVMQSTVHAQMADRHEGLESFNPVETDLDKELKAVSGRFKTRGGARAAAKKSAQDRARRLGTDLLEEEARAASKRV